MSNIYINSIVLIIAINQHSVVVQLPDQHNHSRILGNVDLNTGAMVLEKLDIFDKNEGILKSKGEQTEVVDLNHTEKITATQNVYYSL